MTLQDTNVSIAIRTTLVGGLDLQTQVSNLQWTRGFALDNGVGSGQADLVWSDEVTIAASGTLDTDLAAGVTSAFGATLTFVKVKVLAVFAAAGNTNNVVVGNAAANQFLGPFGAAAHTVSVPPGNMFCVTNSGAGWTVTAGTGDLLRLTNSGAGTGVTAQLVVIGTSA